MKRFLSFFLLVFLGLCAQAQQADEVLMVVGGKSVTVGEFLHAFQKNNQQGRNGLEQYLEDFKHYKVRVAYAEKQGYDTLSAVRQQLDYFQKCMEAGMPVVQERKQNAGSGQSLYIGHLFLPLLQHEPSYNTQYVLKTRVDSVYNQILGGQDFLKVVNAVSPSTRNEHWIFRNETLEEVERQAFALNEGEMSQPFLDYDGYHLVKVLRKGDSGLGAGRVEAATAQLLDSHLLAEYRDGLLLNELIREQGMEETVVDEHELQKYFNANRKQYEWNIPHFKGVLYHCKDAKTLKKVAKLLKKNPMEHWEAIAKGSVHAKLFAHVEMGSVQLYKLGQDAQVDALVFGGPKQPARADYPFSGVSGKKLKKGPDSLADLRDQVESDYRQEQEKQQLDRMMKLVPVEIDMKVFKKLNK